MSEQQQPIAAVVRWHDGKLHSIDHRDAANNSICVADSWFVTEGSSLALGLHRSRFFAGMPDDVEGKLDADGFWNAAIALIPREGEWFPRVELHQLDDANYSLVFRLRVAPDRQRSVSVASWHGDDPRTHPQVKGPDLDAMSRIRAAVQPRGAGEAVILSPDGYIVEGAYSSLVWWRGNILCAPALDLNRVDSVTAKALAGVAGALGTDVHFEAVTPAEIGGTELWALSALHGPRIVTEWVDGPGLAELPGRLGLWRDKLDALRRPVPAPLGRTVGSVL